MKTDSKLIGSPITRKAGIRFDLEIISDLIDDGSKVLDIGCGSGELLKHLKKNKKIDGRGLEILPTYVGEAVRNGISVMQGNAENDLAFYPDNSFDYAILSQTIQAMNKPKNIMEQMLRIAKFAIISLPNFANFKNRAHLLFKGRMPVSKAIPYEWYDTPNIHFCSIKDFEKLCWEMGFDIKKRIYLTNNGKLAWLIGGGIMANFFAEYGIFLISKDSVAVITESKFVFARNNPLFGSNVANAGLANESK